MKTFEVIYKTRGPEMCYVIQAASEAEARSIADRFVKVEAPGARFFLLREKQEVAA